MKVEFELLINKEASPKCILKRHMLKKIIINQKE
jgi:hypothetical protein